MTKSLPSLALLCLSVWTTRGESFSPESAAARAARQNPVLLAARFSIEEARGRALQSGRLPAPEVETELAPNVKGREGSFEIAFVQKFPLTNRLRLERAVSEAQITAAEAEVEATEQKLEAEVMGHALRWLALRDSRELKKKQMTGGEALAAEMNRVASRGEGSPVEAAQFELESQEISLDLLKLESGLTTLEGAVRPLLGLPAGKSLAFTGSLEIPGAPEAPRHGLRADQRAARAKAEAARRTVELARAGKWEDVSVALGYTREHTDDAGVGMERENFISLRFSFPLPLSRNNAGKLVEAQAAAARAEAESAALDAAISAETEAALAEMKAARRAAGEASDKLLPKARELEEKITGFLRQGQPGATLPDVLRARERRLALEQARVDALLSFHLARIRLASAGGR